ncbi:MAG: ATP-binding protein [Chlorobi bacterium]|nr:ATP-binding protein [Chlorobiota bacterium]
MKKSQSRFGRIIVLTGARQTGKTTLAKHLFPNYQYISVEDPVAVQEFKKLTAAQWNSLFPKAILDEIQKEPQLIESIKSVYDQYPDAEYIMLGSSQITLLRKVRESLAGRSQLVEMYPLTLPEMLTKGWETEIGLSYYQNLILNNSNHLDPFLLKKDHPNKQETFETYLKFGAYPAISDTSIPDDEKNEWLNNYVRTYLERDIRDLAELRNLEPFTKVQKLLALNTAQLLNYSRIAAEAGVSSKTVQRFLEYMNISYQTLLLQPWCKNIKKRMVKSPKAHYLDTGVLRAILRKNDTLNGHEFESAIVSEIYKQTKVLNLDLSFYHLRTLDGREVDLLIETEEGYIAVEIKIAETVRTADAGHLRGLNNILDKPVLQKFVISNDMNARELEDGVIAISAVQFLT